MLRTRSPRRRAFGRPRAAPSYFFSAAALPLELSICLPEVNFQKQGSPELGQGDEPRGSTREESGGDVHSAEGPRAAHAEEDGVKSDCQRGGIPAHLCRGRQQPAQPAATALHRPGCRGCGDGVFQIGDGRPEAVAGSSLEPLEAADGQELCMAPLPVEWWQTTVFLPLAPLTPANPPQPATQQGWHQGGL